MHHLACRHAEGERKMVPRPMCTSRQWAQRIGWSSVNLWSVPLGNFWMKNLVHGVGGFWTNTAQTTTEGRLLRQNKFQTVPGTAETYTRLSGMNELQVLWNPYETWRASSNQRRHVLVTFPSPQEIPEMVSLKGRNQYLTWTSVLEISVHSLLVPLFSSTVAPWGNRR
jgi:hypothetical protein